MTTNDRITKAVEEFKDLGPHLKNEDKIWMIWMPKSRAVHFLRAALIREHEETEREILERIEKMLTGRLPDPFKDSGEQEKYHCESSILFFGQKLKKGTIYNVTLLPIFRIVTRDMISIKMSCRYVF